MTDPRHTAELAAEAREMAAAGELPTRVRAMISDLAVIVESMGSARDEDRIALRRIRRALGAHPRCDIHPDDDPASCGWKRVVQSVQAAIDDHRPAIGTEADNARLYREIADQRNKHLQTAEMLEVALQDAATVLGIDDSDLLDADVMAALAAAARNAAAEDTDARADRTPPHDAAVTRMEPRA